MSWTDSSPISFMVLQFPKTTRCTVPIISLPALKADSGIEFKDSWNHRLRPRSPPQVRCKSLPPVPGPCQVYSWTIGPAVESFREENRLLFEVVVQACLAHRGARLVIGRNLKNDLLQI